MPDASRVFVLDPERTALIIVDMQNDFVRSGAPLEVPEARATIPRPTVRWKWSPVLAEVYCPYVG
jgi:ureidoacrylate peracid hydrolase